MGFRSWTETELDGFQVRSFKFFQFYTIVGRYWWCLISLIHSFLPFLFPSYSSISLH
ncbi:hypothetical protein Syun_023027 [Stephania yunnanensis]|uniref:Uncharacterized protein n=1 Tax=Stephania yunnanensis TaxID=152371 RepID=A0AAP0F868_9MAGN